MGQRRLHDGMGRVGAFRRPVAETRTEAVHHRVETERADQVHQRRVRQRPAAPRAGEHETAAVVERARPGEDRERAARQGDAVRAPGFHTLGGHGPHCAGAVHLAPCGRADLARTRGGEDEELEREPHGRSRVGSAHRGEGGRDLVMRQRPEMTRRRAVAPGQRRADRLAGGVVGAPALRDRPQHDLADALAHTLRRRRRAAPDRRKHRHHVRRADGGDGERAETRESVTFEDRKPLPGMFRAPPRGAMERVHGPRRLGEGRDAAARGPARQRVAAGARQPPVVERLRARFRQRHQRAAAEAERPVPPLDAQPLHPAPRPRRVHLQVEAVAVAIAARLRDRAHEGQGEGVFGVLPFLAPLRRSAACVAHAVPVRFHVQFPARGPGSRRRRSTRRIQGYTVYFRIAGGVGRARAAASSTAGSPRSISTAS